MRIFDTLYAQSDEFRLGHHIPPAAGDGSMNGTDFVTTEFHGNPLSELGEASGRALGLKV